MHRAPLLELLARYQAQNPREHDVAARISALVVAQPDCFERTCRPGHITGSAWVMSDDRTRFLLVHHRKLNRWLQPGGHADGDADVAQVALREAREESGLNQLRLAGVPISTPPHLPLRSPIPWDLDVHVIPAHYDASGRLIDDAHEHHDVRFLVFGSADEAPLASAESHDAKWFTAGEVGELTQDESVLRMLRKSLEQMC